MPQDCSPSKRSKGAPVSGAAEDLEEGELHQWRVRKRGHGSRRPRMGQVTWEQKQQGPMGEGRMGQLRARTFHDSEAILANSFSISENSVASSTGWQGRAPPKKTQRELEALYRSGEIVELLKFFYPVPYLIPLRFTFHSSLLLQPLIPPLLHSPQRECGATFIDRDGCTFIYRSFHVLWLPEHAGDLSEAIQALLHDTLSSEVIKKQHRGGLRGSHYPCIIGHSRQYQKVRGLF